MLAELAALPEADVVLNAVVGFAGLPATLAALEHGKRLALANKESLIAGGPVVAEARARGGGEIVPVDSEHSAIYQALRAGGPRRGAPHPAHRERRALPRPSRAELAARHRRRRAQPPDLDMGAKITIDSSTLMNKGLEVIEAHELFGVDFDRVEVVVHPQSVVHGMVEFTDGATVAQLSMPDMRLPIGLALGAPDRLDQPFGAIDWTPTRGRSPSSRRTSRPSRASGSPTRPAGPAGAPRRLSAAPTRSRSRRSSAGRIPWLGIADVVEDVHPARAPGTSMTSPTFWKRTGSRASEPRHGTRSTERRSAA